MTVPNMIPRSTSISSQENDSFICTKVESHLNLPFNNDIATVNANIHSYILSENVNILEISTGHHTLDITCDGIGNYEIDIACLVETNIH